MGISVIADRVGPVPEENFYADFSYTIKIGDQTNLAFGLKAGATFLSAPLAFLNTVNSGDIAFQNNLNRVTPNFGFETYYYSDNYYLGFALPNLLKIVHFERKSGVISKAVEEIHYFFTGGYVFDMKNEIKFKPSFLVKVAVGAPISIDYSANILFQDNIEFGLSVRYDDSVSVIFSLNITEKLRM
ncbi:PorP/SprF family type IX secretion system membrane protein [Tenacibaculum sp. C7A-26P2]|uniref:PorP/SprF family type IX secretion system membrane protein n=1 Tax=Tenacibaculum sp. C7A-26P2 TaxID=3447504 RepID=UPI003F8759A7